MDRLIMVGSLQAIITTTQAIKSMVRRQHGVVVKHVNSRVKSFRFISHLLLCMCPVSTPVKWDISLDCYDNYNN